jgi:hypothetical protein
MQVHAHRVEERLEQVTVELVAVHGVGQCGQLIGL